MFRHRSSHQSLQHRLLPQILIHIYVAAPEGVFYTGGNIINAFKSRARQTFITGLPETQEANNTVEDEVWGNRE